MSRCSTVSLVVSFRLFLPFFSALSNSNATMLLSPFFSSSLCCCLLIANILQDEKRTTKLQKHFLLCLLATPRWIDAYASAILIRFAFFFAWRSKKSLSFPFSPLRTPNKFSTLLLLHHHRRRRRRRLDC